MTLFYIVEVALAFGFMITIHEWGHYIAMRLCGVEVQEFAIGFGPTLFSREWGNTLFAVRAIPLGGFCLPQGGDLSGKSVEEMAASVPVPGDFLFASWWKRVIIATAGPAMNFVSAVVLLFFLFAAVGEKTPFEKPVIGFVPPGSLAEKAGLREGDRLLKVMAGKPGLKKGDIRLKGNGKEITNLQTADDLYPDYGKSAVLLVQRKGRIFEAKIERPAKTLTAWETSRNPFLRFLAALGFGPDGPPEPSLGISSFVPPVVGTAAMGNPARNAGLQDGDEITGVNGHKVTEWAELTYLIREIKTGPLKIEFLRGHKSHTVSIQPIFNGSYNQIGILPVDSKQEEVKKVSVFRAGGDSVVAAFRFCEIYLQGILKIIVGKVSLKDSMAGPVTIVRMMYNQASHGWEDFLNIVVMISLILCLTNLFLPISLLDGGQIFLFLIEGIKRKPLTVKTQVIYQNVGVVFIICLVILVFFNDFKNIYLEIHNHIH